MEIKAKKSKGKHIATIKPVLDVDRQKSSPDFRKGVANQAGLSNVDSGGPSTKNKGGLELTKALDSTSEVPTKSGH